MKKILLLLIGTLLLSCGDNGEIEPVLEKKNYAEVEVYYKLQSSDDLYPDKGSQVFVYYGILTLDLLGYDMGKDGIWVKESHTVIPNGRFKTNIEGKCEFQTEEKEKVTIIVQSNYYDGRVVANSWYDSVDGISFKAIVMP